MKSILTQILIVLGWLLLLPWCFGRFAQSPQIVYYDPDEYAFNVSCLGCYTPPKEYSWLSWFG